MSTVKRKTAPKKHKGAKGKRKSETKLGKEEKKEEKKEESKHEEPRLP